MWRTPRTDSPHSWSPRCRRRALLAALEPVMSEARRLRGAPASAEPAPPDAVHDAAKRTSREVVRELLAGDTTVSAEQVMETTGVGRRRAYELLAQVRAEGNGKVQG
jgi:hypothetical protein